MNAAQNTSAGEKGSAAALMDSVYRNQRYIYDLTRKYYLFGRDRLIADLLPGRGAVLEIGCGTGRNLAAVASRYPEAALYGFDISTAMLETARAAFARKNISGRVEVAQADATLFDAGTLFGRTSFDRVYFSYTLSMIPAWRAALDQAAACVAPGGRLMIVDFGQLDGYPAWARAALYAWLRAFHVHPIADLREALRDLAARHGMVLQWRPLYRGYAVYAVLERPA